MCRHTTFRAGGHRTLKKIHFSDVFIGLTSNQEAAMMMIVLIVTAFPQTNDRCSLNDIHLETKQKTNSRLSSCAADVMRHSRRRCIFFPPAEGQQSLDIWSLMTASATD